MKTENHALDLKLNKKTVKNYKLLQAEHSFLCTVYFLLLGGLTLKCLDAKCLFCGLLYCEKWLKCAVHMKY